MCSKRLVVVFCLMWLVAGCSHVYHPRKHVKNNDPDAPTDVIDIVLDLDRIGPYPPGCSVSLRNDVTDNKDRIFRKAGLHKFIVNYQEWTQFLIEEWSKQLVKRGVDVSPRSPNVIYVSVSDFNWVQGMFVVKAELEVKLFKQGVDWLRTYYGHARRPVADYSAAVYQTIAELLDKPDLIDQMR